MIKRAWRSFLILFVVGFGVGLFRVPILKAVTASYNQTIRIVSSTGTVLNGIASAVTANYNETVQVVDSTGHVIDSFGGASGTVTSVTGTVNQVAVATGTTTPVISLVGPYTSATYTTHGVLLGEGTSSIAAMAVCSTGAFPYGQSAADPICSTLILPNSATQGDLLMATSPNTIGSLADVATGQVLASGGTSTVPAYTANPQINSIGVGTAADATAGDVKFTQNVNSSLCTPQTAVAGELNVCDNATQATIAFGGQTSAGTLDFGKGQTGVFRFQSKTGTGTGSVGIVGGLEIGAAGNVPGTGSLVFSGDSAVTVASMARMPFYFDEGQQSALTANESLGTYKVTKGITIENIEADIKISPTCSVSEVITCFDCGTSAGACTSAQTATISTTTVASGATRQSVDQTVSTANVAAGHYISCLMTAGTCTVSDTSIVMMARPQ